MADPKIVDKCFEVVDLTPGTYYWCACGQSQKQPFCDGSHKGSEFQPRKIDVTEECRMKLCLCKHTKTPNGVCDGTHNDL
ncbi:MAG TPA: CDGSH iron-sulfur domain-containing protein [Pseudobdellovibrionaceae bacterium]|nr:CDGSH iron-sulfur domain-containing protein [Pseudobdellovibrionaceae bacterium]